MQHHVIGLLQSWIIEMLETVKVADSVKSLLCGSMSDWETANNNNSNNSNNNDDDDDDEDNNNNLLLVKQAYYWYR